MVRIKVKGKKITIDDNIEILLDDLNDIEIFEFLIFLVNHFMSA